METNKGKAALRKVLKWLQKEGNTTLKLACLLEYKTPLTISRWIKEGYVPDREIERVVAAIHGEEK